MNMGNPKRSSKFICLRCKGIRTKNLEIRWCDDFLEALDKAEQIRCNYYSNKENNNNRKVG